MMSFPSVNVASEEGILRHLPLSLPDLAFQKTPKALHGATAGSCTSHRALGLSAHAGWWLGSQSNGVVLREHDLR